MLGGFSKMFEKKFNFSSRLTSPDIMSLCDQFPTPNREGQLSIITILFLAKQDYTNFDFKSIKIPENLRLFSKTI